MASGTLLDLFKKKNFKDFESRKLAVKPENNIKIPIQNQPQTSSG
jgi:hypothetical protein